MTGFENALNEAGLAILKERARAGVQSVTGADGLPCCAKCGESLMLRLTFSGTVAEAIGKERYVPRNCDCMRKLHAEELAAEERSKQLAVREQIRRFSLRERKYREKTFAEDDGRDKSMRKMCERYVRNWGEMVDGEYGLAFIGANGCGKTFWASCIANALIDAGATVLMIKLKTLIDEASANFGEYREATLEKVRIVDFLILDDYGAERGNDYSLEQSLEIIDTRYNSGKPLIITANLTEDALKNPSDIRLARAYSRIVEMCPAIIKMHGERREEIATDKRKELARLLRGEEARRC